MADQAPQVAYPMQGELNNDADMLCLVVAGMLRQFGTDPVEIDPVQAWIFYVTTWKDGIVRTGQMMPPNWEAMVSGDSPLRKAFLEQWQVNQRGNRLIGNLVLPPGLREMMTSDLRKLGA